MTLEEAADGGYSLDEFKDLSNFINGLNDKLSFVT